MEEKSHQEITESVSKLQWALGEVTFRAKKLQKHISNDPDLAPEFEAKMKEFLKMISLISSQYRHDIGDALKSKLS
jgi:hypothetical protein